MQVNSLGYLRTGDAKLIAHEATEHAARSLRGGTAASSISSLVRRGERELDGVRLGVGDPKGVPTLPMILMARPAGTLANVVPVAEPRLTRVANDFELLPSLQLPAGRWVTTNGSRSALDSCWTRFSQRPSISAAPARDTQ